MKNRNPFAIRNLQSDDLLRVIGNSNRAFAIRKVSAGWEELVASDATGAIAGTLDIGEGAQTFVALGKEEFLRHMVK
jgi:hypothetical protein